MVIQMEISLEFIDAVPMQCLNVVSSNPVNYPMQCLNVVSSNPVNYPLFIVFAMCLLGLTSNEVNG